MSRYTLLKRAIRVTFLFIFLSNVANGQQFAIVTDRKSYDEAREEIELYSKTLTDEGLSNIIIVDKWGHPDSIRTVLHTLYLNNKLFEGAVFIGNIPIPMIRDAQHMTSAFKMDQERYSWERSSVTSDRFYEDFDLKFTYLKQDTSNLLLHYYSLNFDSPQRIKPEIYSGRIRIPWDENSVLLKAYLKKVVLAHLENNLVDEVLFFAGHGYNSESMTARIDEKVSLLQQFPQLNRQGNGLEFIDYSFEDHIKFRLLTTLAGEDIDIAILHHHGATDAELVDGEQAAIGVQSNIESIKVYLRSKVRDAKDPEASRKNYINWLGVPDDWFNLVNDNVQTIKDSIFWADMDIMASDVRKYVPRPKFIMFDACFNGSFQVDDFISGQYVFGNSRTISAQGNTVNSIQDKFPDEMIGLLALGMRVGEWNKLVCTLESHIIGDPTFRFSSSGKVNADELLKVKGNNKKLLKLTAYPHPDVQSWALRQLSDNDYSGISKLLYDKYFSSPYYSTRMQCMKLLSSYCNDDFIKVLAAALDDSYELVRRMAAIYAWKSGSPAIIPEVIKAAIDPNISKRVNYQLGNALGFFDREALIKELNNQFRSIDTTGNYFGTIWQEVNRSVMNKCNSTDKTIEAIVSQETVRKNKVFEVRSLRNQTYHTAIPALCKFLANDCDDEDIQLSLIEAMGWFCYSYNKKEIIETCSFITNSEKFSVEVRNEAFKTILRLQDPN